MAGTQEDGNPARRISRTRSAKELASVLVVVVPCRRLAHSAACASPARHAGPTIPESVEQRPRRSIEEALEGIDAATGRAREGCSRSHRDGRHVACGKLRIMGWQGGSSARYRGPVRGRPARRRASARARTVPRYLVKTRRRESKVLKVAGLALKWWTISSSRPFSGLATHPAEKRMVR